MAVVIETSVWEPNPWLYVLLFSTSLLLIALLSGLLSKKHSTSAGKAPTTVFDNGISPSLLRLQRNFLLVYHLVSVVGSFGSAFDEFELANYGVNKDQILFFLCVGQAASLFCGTFLGVFSDILGQKKACLIFCIIHVFVGLMKIIAGPSSSLASSICLSLSASILSFSFETWMVIQHDERGHRRDTLNEVFWLMSFFESVSLIEGQVLSNWLIGNNVEKNISSPSIVAVILAMIGIICITKGWLEVSQKVTLKEYKMSLRMHIIGDKRVLALAWVQACLHFSTLVFWILWAPTVVADGREVRLGLIYACFVGSRMLGSTIFPWLTGGLSSLRTEECMVYAFSILGVIFLITAYDYQEVGVLLALFCLFNATVGVILPSLARLRTLYVPNQLRGGIISLSQAPAHAAMLFFLVQRSYNQNISNAGIFSIAALGVFTAAFCMHMLRRLGKQPYQSGHKLFQYR